MVPLVPQDRQHFFHASDGTPTQASGVSNDTRWLWLANPMSVVAALSVYAGLIHLWVAPSHMRAWWGFGAFFLVVGVAQVAFAFLLWRRPGTTTALAGIVGNVSVVLVYILSRTKGVPLGPIHSAHRLEAAGPLDMTATAVEVVLAGLLLGHLHGRIRSSTVNGLFLIGLALWGLRLSGVMA